MTAAPALDRSYAPAPRPAAARSGKASNIGLWGLQVFVAAFFAFASSAPKLTGHSSARPTFDAIGAGDWFMYFVGTLELAGAIALVVPALSGLAAMAFMGLMAGAFTFEVTVIESGFWYTPVIIFAVMAVIAWGRRDSLRRLAKTASTVIRRR